MPTEEQRVVFQVLLIIARSGDSITFSFYANAIREKKWTLELKITLKLLEIKFCFSKLGRDVIFFLSDVIKWTGVGTIAVCLRNKVNKIIKVSNKAAGLLKGCHKISISI